MTDYKAEFKPLLSASEKLTDQIRSAGAAYVFDGDEAGNALLSDAALNCERLKQRMFVIMAKYSAYIQSPGGYDDCLLNVTPPVYSDADGSLSFSIPGLLPLRPDVTAGRFAYSVAEYKSNLKRIMDRIFDGCSFGKYSVKVRIDFKLHYAFDYYMPDCDNVDVKAVIDEISMRFLLDDSPKHCCYSVDSVCDGADRIDVTISKVPA